LQLRAEGDFENVVIQEEDLRSKAGLISTHDLLAWSDWPTYPPVEIYGRVFVLGGLLIAATSWEDVKRLVSADVLAWVSGLGPEPRERAEEILAA
jgi:hypothetical protein